jgi:type II restriction/modification system DNA methylase subunit YeeA
MITIKELPKVLRDTSWRLQKGKFRKFSHEAVNWQKRICAPNPWYLFRKKQEASPHESFSNKTPAFSTLRLPRGKQNSGLKHFFQTYGKPHSKYSIPIVSLVT